MSGTKVISITSINKEVSRVECSDATFDVPSRFFSPQPGTFINVCVNNTPSDADVVMSGVVYNVNDKEVCVSCGGLLSMLQTQALSLDDEVELAFTRINGDANEA